jgi:hypothetical protein
MLTDIMRLCLPLPKKMIDELLRVDANIFKEFRYDDSTQIVRTARENISIDRLI